MAGFSLGFPHCKVHEPKPAPISSCTVLSRSFRTIKSCLRQSRLFRVYKRLTFTLVLSAGKSVQRCPVISGAGPFSSFASFSRVAPLTGRRRRRAPGYHSSIPLSKRGGNNHSQQYSTSSSGCQRWMWRWKVSCFGLSIWNQITRYGLRTKLYHIRDR